MHTKNQKIMKEKREKNFSSSLLTIETAALTTDSIQVFFKYMNYSLEHNFDTTSQYSTEYSS